MNMRQYRYTNGLSQTQETFKTLQGYFYVVKYSDLLKFIKSTVLIIGLVSCLKLDSFFSLFAYILPTVKTKLVGLKMTSYAFPTVER